MRNEPYDYLPRLEPGFYRGQAYVHWVMTIQDRKTGWLIPNFYYNFREILTHAAFRYAYACPIYCLMPDHIERKNLVTADQFKSYPYTDCLMPGYPELRIWQPDFWTRFWRCYSFLRKNGLFRPADEEL